MLNKNEIAYKNMIYSTNERKNQFQSPVTDPTEKQNSRSTSAPTKLFSGSLFIQEVDWKHLIRDDSVIREESMDKESRQTSCLSTNINEEIAKLLSSRNNSTLVNRLSQAPEEQKLNDKSFYPPIKSSFTKDTSQPVNFQPANNAFQNFAGINLTNLVVRNENNQALFNKLAWKMENDNPNIQMNIFNGLSYKPNFASYPEEFDKNRVKLAGEMAKDQLGCRLLQKWLDLKNPDITKEIFMNVIKTFGELMKDPFGNYLCQKLIEIGNAEQIKRIIENIYEDFLDIAINQHGTRALQKLLENLRDEGNYKTMIALLKNNIFPLINDNNGNHVIQKCLQTMNCDQKQFIYDVCLMNCVEISNHKHGCCVIQRCIDFGNSNQKKFLLCCIVKNTLLLIVDQFGNFVIQYILEMKEMLIYKKAIIEKMTENLVELIKQKFSSNIIEKSMKMKIFSFDEAIIKMLINTPLLPELLLDKYGNYVVQSALALSSETEKERMLQIILNCALMIKADTFGSKIYAKLAKNYPILLLDVNPMFFDQRFYI